MIELITLYAMRSGTSVIILDSEKENIKGIFRNTGYRPTKATKKITLNCCLFKLKWLNENGKLIN